MPATARRYGRPWLFQCEETALRAEGDWLTFAVVWRGAGHMVGEIGLKLISRTRRPAEIGFVFNPDYHGRGLATEAAESMLMLGFDTIGWHRIIVPATPAIARLRGSWSGSACARRRASCTTRSSRESGQTSSCTPSSIMSGEHDSRHRYSETVKVITVSVPDDVYRDARVAAAERDALVSALVVAYLERLSGRQEHVQQA